MSQRKRHPYVYDKICHVMVETSYNAFSPRILRGLFTHLIIVFHLGDLIFDVESFFRFTNYTPSPLPRCEGLFLFFSRDPHLRRYGPA